MTNQFERPGVNCSSGREPALANILASDSWILNSASTRALRLLKASKGYLRLLKPILTIIFYFLGNELSRDRPSSILSTVALAQVEAMLRRMDKGAGTVLVIQYVDPSRLLTGTRPVRGSVPLVSLWQKSK
jgi:hypothetical protein